MTDKIPQQNPPANDRDYNGVIKQEIRTLVNQKIPQIEQRILNAIKKDDSIRFQIKDSPYNIDDFSNLLTDSLYSLEKDLRKKYGLNIEKISSALDAIEKKAGLIVKKGARLIGNGFKAITIDPTIPLHTLCGRQNTAPYFRDLCHSLDIPVVGEQIVKAPTGDAKINIAALAGEVSHNTSKQA